jgi:serine/threonine-protein kinase
MAWYHYQGHLDYENASLAFERVLRRDPGDPNAEQGLAAISRRQGRFEDALAGFYRVADADPRNPQVFDDIGWTLDLLGRHEEAQAAYRASLALDSTSVEVLGDVTNNRLLAGDLDGAAGYLSRIPDPISVPYFVASLFTLMERIAGRHEALVVRLERVDRPLLEDNQLRVRPVDLVIGDVLSELGRTDEARARYASAVRLLEQMRSADPGDPRVHAALGLAFASLGRRAEAVRSAGAALDLLPIEREAVRGASLMDELARVHTRLGDKDAAFDMLGRLFALQDHRVITPALARLDPEWASLREDARFEALLTRVEHERE